MNYKGREPRDRPQQALEDLGASSDAYLQSTIPSWQTDSSQCLAERLAC